MVNICLLIFRDSPQSSQGTKSRNQPQAAHKDVAKVKKNLKTQMVMRKFFKSVSISGFEKNILENLNALKLLKSVGKKSMQFQFQIREFQNI